jgi:NAD(P)-dependent dehydrogenase (short-subunit alcohol dehydrogenase family)
MAAATSDVTARRMGGQAGEVLAAHPRLDVPVNNAGGSWVMRRVTADGLEHTLTVDHLTPFLLSGRLEASATARIVSVSSAALATEKLDVGDLHPDLPGLLPSSGERNA